MEAAGEAAMEAAGAAAEVRNGERKRGREDQRADAIIRRLRNDFETRFREKKSFERSHDYFHT